MNRSLRISKCFGPLLKCAVLAAVSLPVWGQSTPLSCVATVTPVFNVRVEGFTERTSDVLLSCQGGFPTPVNQTVPLVTFQLFTNVNVTSRELAPGWSEALLFVDEPTPAFQVVCISANGICPLTGTGSGAGTYNGAAGRTNVFQGARPANNSLQWTVPFDPPGANATRRLRFTNLRVNASQLLVSSTQIPTQVLVNLTSGQAVPITNPTQTVAYVQPSFTRLETGQAESTGGRLSKFSMIFEEYFSNVFKPMSSAGPFPAAQSQLPLNGGSVPGDYETGFYNPQFPDFSRGSLSVAGLSYSGTRVLVRMEDIPVQATITAPLTVAFGSSGLARLVVADEYGYYEYEPATTGVLQNIQGVVTAVYEIVAASPTVRETLEVVFTITHGNGAPPFPVLQGFVGLAPLSGIATASFSEPIPRFSFDYAPAFTVRAPADPVKITTLTLPSATLGSLYLQTIQATGGTPPYTFTLQTGATSVLPPGLTLQSNGIVSGIPNTPGTYRFTVIARDSLTSSVSATQEYSITISATGTLMSSVGALTFSASLSGAPPPIQSVLLSSSSLTPLPFTVVVDSGTSGSLAPTWIQVSPPAGKTPALLSVSVNQGTLSAGTYTARIRVSIDGSTQAPTDIVVTLKVASVVSKLESSVNVLRFRARTAAPGKQTGFLLLSNSGGNGAITYNSSVAQRSPWIVGVTPSSGSAGATTPTKVSVTIDTTGLVRGIYRDVIRFTSASGNVDVPVVLRITPAGPLLETNQTGVQFSMTEGVPTLATREVKILNGEPLSALSWKAEIIRGGDWLTLTPASGVATQLAPGLLKLAVKSSSASLRAGSYYALIRVTSAGTTYSPRYVVAVLSVKSPGQSSGIDIDQGGTILTGVARGQNSSHVFTLNAASTTPIAFQAAASTTDGGSWLSVSSSASSVASTRSETVTVTASPTGLAAGVYTGQVTIAAANFSQTLNIVFIVTDTLGDALQSSTRNAGACTPDRVVFTNTGLTNSFTVPAAWPVSLTVDVRDNCNAAVSTAAVVATFTNGDPPLTLLPEGTSSQYSATWKPGVVFDQMNVKISALTANYPQAFTTLVGTVKENVAPTLARDGTVNNLNPKLGGLLAPGLVAAVYGDSLATVAESTGVVPLQTEYKGTSVLVGPYEAPLFFVSPGQLNVQLPSELNPDSTYPIVVSVNGAITLPDEIDVVATQAGVAAFSDGRLIAQNSLTYTLVDNANPAKRNDYLTIYLVGLGATDPQVASGARSPATPPFGIPTAFPTLTIDGQAVPIGFAGLTPDGVGLFQINFQVPSNARLNTPLDVVVQQGGYTANVTQLTVVP